MKTIKHISQLLRIKSKIQPKSYFEELAEQGILYEYVEKYHYFQLKHDEDFRNNVFELIAKYEHPGSPVTLKYYLLRMVESMSFFKEYTKEWITTNK